MSGLGGALGEMLGKPLARIFGCLHEEEIWTTHKKFVWAGPKWNITILINFLNWEKYYYPNCFEGLNFHPRGINSHEP